MNQKVRKSNFPKDKSIRLTLHLYLSNRKTKQLCMSARKMVVLLADGIWFLARIWWELCFNAKQSQNVIKQTLIRKTQWTFGLKTGIRIRFIFFLYIKTYHNIKTTNHQGASKPWWDRYDDHWVVCFIHSNSNTQFCTRIKYSPVCAGCGGILVILILIWSCVMCGSFIASHDPNQFLWHHVRILTAEQWTNIIRMCFCVLTMRIHIVKSNRKYSMFLCMIYNAQAKLQSFGLQKGESKRVQ